MQVMIRRLIAACIISLFGAGFSVAGKNSWTPLGELTSTVNVVSYVPSQSERLYAGAADGIYVSLNSGQTWTNVGGATITSSVLSVEIDSVDPRRVYAGVSNGVYVSADDGQSWTKAPDLTSGVLSLRTARARSALVYAGTFGRGVFVSSDRGATFQAGGSELQSDIVFALETTRNDEKTVFAGTARGLFVSHDGAQSWQILGENLVGLSVREIYISQIDSERMYIGTFTSGIYRSDDGGLNWMAVNDGLDVQAIRSLAVDPNDESRLYVATTTGGFYRTAPTTERWESINTGLPRLAARDVTVLPSAPVRILGTGPGTGVWEISFAPQPALQVARAPVVYGETAVRETRVRTIAMVNAGDTDLQVSSFHLGGASAFSVLDPEAPLTMIAGEATAIWVQFFPQVGGVQRDTLEIRSNDPNEAVIAIPLRGTGVNAELSSDFSTLVFGTVPIGQFKDITIELSNTGSAPLQLQNAFFENLSFRVLDFTPQVLQPSERIMLPVRFIPFSPGGINSKLVILNDSAVQPRFEIQANGLAIAPDLTVLQSLIDFGTVDVGSGKRLSLAISNSGNMELVIDNIELDGDAYRIASVTPLTLQPGKLFELEVTFLPTVAGDYPGSLTIESDAPGPMGRRIVKLSGAGGALTLIPQEPVSLGPGPVAMIVDDWNLDGYGDVAIADSASGRIRVLLGDGSGVFPENLQSIYPSFVSVYEPWDEPVAIASAPILSSSPDLIVADRLARSISIVRNNGHGSFDTSREDIYIGYAVADVHAVDLDADGDIDLAVADGENPSVTLLFNNGRGTFNARSSHVVEATPSAIAAGNLNSDGHKDLVIANTGMGTVSVLLSNRNGGFQGRRDFAVGTRPVAIHLADYDADGDNDILTANSGSMDVTILGNDGDGSFDLVRRIGLGMRPLDLAVSDLSADIFSDLIVAGHSSPHVAFLENNASGDFFVKEIEITDLPSRGVAIVNIDVASDTVGTNDILVLSATDKKLQVFLNTDTRRQDPPRPPEGVVAQDVERDLGRRIEVLWQAPELDEQIGRTISYGVFRAKSAMGPFVEIGNVATGNRRFVDVAATLGDTFYYNVRARNSLNGSAASDTVSAASLPSPFFELQLVNEPRLSIGDTLKVRAFITPAEHHIAGLSFYATFEDSALNLVQADSIFSGIVPFRPDSASLGNFKLLENGLQPGNSRKINFSIANLKIPPGVDPIPLGEIWFRTTKDAVASISIDDEPTLNRQSAVVEAVTGSFLLPFIPSRATQVSISDFQVTGQVALEGRTAPNLGEQVSLFFLRRDGSTLLSPLNDEDRLQPGIQYTLNDNGRFELVQIPKDTYRVFLKPPSHLQGQVTTDSVVVGDSLKKHLTFKWSSPVSADSSNTLLAGDATDDNLINMADFGLWVRHFGTSSVEKAVWSQAKGADFNQDNRVNNDDFFLFAQNFGRIGVQLPIVVQKKTRSRGNAFLDVDNRTVRVTDLGPIVGYALRLSSGVRLEAGHLGTIWEHRETRVMSWRENGDLRVLVAERNGEAVVGTGVLAFLDMVEVRANVDLEILLDDGQVLTYKVARKQLPLRSALLPNYPNPFNPRTVIPFAVASTEGADGVTPVSIEVFNVLGQKMRTLVSADLMPGYHKVSWDGRNDGGLEVASGIYIYRLCAGDYQQSRRLLLVR